MERLLPAHNGLNPIIESNMATYHLYRWSVQFIQDPYQAPEQAQSVLIGFRDQDTKRVRTSNIVAVNGREVTTYSGSVYILEDVDPEYQKWLDDQGIEIDQENPIKFKVA